MLTFPKPMKGASKLKRRSDRLKAAKTERDHKAEAKKRDGSRCRFPLCGCRRFGFRLESSHDRHKGMGGNPEGDRSLPPGLITMCIQRHQNAVFCRHRGTVVNRYLTDQGNDGPVVWDVDVETLLPYLTNNALRAVVKRAANASTGFVEVARESKVGVLEPLQPWQAEVLSLLATMEI